MVEDIIWEGLLEFPDVDCNILDSRNLFPFPPSNIPVVWSESTIPSCQFYICGVVLYISGGGDSHGKDSWSKEQSSEAEGEESAELHVCDVERVV